MWKREGWFTSGWGGSGSGLLGLMTAMLSSISFLMSRAACCSGMRAASSSWNIHRRHTPDHESAGADDTHHGGSVGHNKLYCNALYRRHLRCPLETDTPPQSSYGDTPIKTHIPFDFVCELWCRLFWVQWGRGGRSTLWAQPGWLTGLVWWEGGALVLSMDQTPWRPFLRPAEKH